MALPGQDGELEYRLPHRCHKLHQDPLAIGRPEEAREGKLGRHRVVVDRRDSAGPRIGPEIPEQGRNGVLQRVGRFEAGLESVESSSGVMGEDLSGTNVDLWAPSA
jgi:hypothetical protein